MDDPDLEISLSVCTYQNGDFEVLIHNSEGIEVVLEGNQKLSKEQLQLLGRWAPACVWTRYRRITPLD